MVCPSSFTEVARVSKTVVHTNNSALPLNTAIDIEALHCECQSGCACEDSNKNKVGFSSLFKSNARSTVAHNLTASDYEAVLSVTSAEYDAHISSRKNISAASQARCSTSSAPVANPVAKSPEVWRSPSDHVDALDVQTEKGQHWMGAIKSGILDGLKAAANEGRITPFFAKAQSVKTWKGEVKYPQYVIVMPGETAEGGVAANWCDEMKYLTSPNHSKRIRPLLEPELLAELSRLCSTAPTQRNLNPSATCPQWKYSQAASPSLQLTC